MNVLNYGVAELDAAEMVAVDGGTSVVDTVIDTVNHVVKMIIHVFF